MLFFRSNVELLEGKLCHQKTERYPDAIFWSEDEQNLPHLRLWTLPLEATRKHMYFNQQESLTKRRGDFSQSWKGCETNRTEEMVHKMENMGMAQTDYPKKWLVFPRLKKQSRFPNDVTFWSQFFLGSVRVGKTIVSCRMYKCRYRCSTQYRIVAYISHYVLFSPHTIPFMVDSIPQIRKRRDVFWANSCRVLYSTTSASKSDANLWTKCIKHRKVKS